MKRLGAIALMLVVATGCGSSSDPLSRAAGALSTIRSGDLFMRAVAETRDAVIGFELDGPFALGEEELPLARMRYTSIHEGTTATFVSDGRAPHIETGDQRIPVRAELLEGLRVLAGEEEGSTLRIDRWLHDPETTDGGVLGGVEVTRTTAKLNLPSVILDLAGLAGITLPQPSDREREMLTDAVRSSRFELLAGKDDDLLRSVVLEVELGVDDAVAERLGELSGARLLLELRIERPNEPVAF